MFSEHGAVKSTDFRTLL